MDFFVQVIPQGQILNSKLKLVKQQAKKKKIMTVQNFKNPPPLGNSALDSHFRYNSSTVITYSVFRTTNS